MTKRLLHNAQVIDPEAGTVSSGDIRIENGMITQVSQSPLSANPNEHAVDCHGKYLAPGIIDIGVKVCEPGERHKESFKSAGLAAAAGGITTMVTRPDTTPAIDSPETLEFIARRANQATPVNVMPMAALTKGRNGRGNERNRLFNRCRRDRLYRLRSRGEQPQGIRSRPELCVRFGRSCYRPPAGTNAVKRRCGNLGKICLAARTARGLGNGRTHGAGPGYSAD